MISICYQQALALNRLSFSFLKKHLNHTLKYIKVIYSFFKNYIF
jgi:hypothetical protein